MKTRLIAYEDGSALLVAGNGNIIGLSPKEVGEVVSKLLTDLLPPELFNELAEAFGEISG
jgi:hypothetical protein